MHYGTNSKPLRHLLRPSTQPIAAAGAITFLSVAVSDRLFQYRLVIVDVKNLEGASCQSILNGWSEVKGAIYAIILNERAFRS